MTAASRLRHHDGLPTCSRRPSATRNNGYPLVERVSATIGMVKDLFRDHWPTSAALFCRQQSAGARHHLHQCQHGGHLRAHPARGAKRRRQSRSGDRARAEIWSQGFVADAIDKFCRTQEVMDTSGRRHRGVLNGQDMAAGRRPSSRRSSYDYGRYTVMKSGPVEPGPVTLQTLASAQALRSRPHRAHRSADFIHHADRGYQARFRRPRYFLR